MDNEPTYEDLKEKVKLLERQIENIGTPMMVYDKSGSLLTINRAAADYMKGKPSDFIGCTMADLSPEHSEAHFQRIQEVFKTGEPSMHEGLVNLPSGQYWFLAKYIPLFNEDKSVCAVQMLAIDITDRKKTEDTLMENEEIFSCFLEHNPIFVFFKDENIRSIRLSKNYEQMLGMPLSKIIGRTMDELFPSDLAKGMIEDDKRVFREGTQITVEEELNCHFYKTIKFPISINGKPKYLAGYTMDITEQKMTKAKLEGNIAFLQTLLDTIPSPIYYTDKEFRILGGNRAWSDMVIGMKIEDVIGQNICDVCKKAPREMLDEHNRKDMELIKNGGIQIFESKIKCNDEQERDFIFYKSIFPDAEGKIAGIVGVMLDISERKLAEEKNKTLQQRLAQAQKMESIGTLAGGIAHDFNNILMPIIAYSDLLKMKLQNDTSVQMDIFQIRKAADRARDLVQQILTFARQKETERIPIKISQLLKETVKLLRSSIPTTVDLHYNIDAQYDTVLADPTQVNQIIMNLSTNAVHAMEEKGGSLEIDLTNENINLKSANEFSKLESGRYIKLTVKDTGHGIRPDLIDKIFEPYFTTKDTGKGTGMGLSIVHGIVKNYDGEITFETEVNKGTSFHVYLPAIETETYLPERHVVSESLLTGTERILAVDDVKISLDTLQSMLEWLGYKVTSRTSSIEALEAFRHNPQGFDLVITDQTMPNMTGKTLAKEIMAIRPDMPVILCTGFSEQIDEKRAKEMGISAFVMKPIVLQQIAKTIREVLGPFERAHRARENVCPEGPE